MLNPEEYTLLHMRVNSSGDQVQIYDAAKAHDYYMRTRVLKGRTPVVQKTPVGRSKGTPVSTVGSRSGVKVVQNVKVVPKKTAAELAKERVALKAHVAALQVRLEALKKVLAQLVKEAKARSGVVTKPTTDNSPVTAAQKKTAAAKSSAKYYDKNKATILAKAKADAAANPTDLEAKIKEISDKIAKMRADLASKLKR
jgi:hypothetical protein